MNIDLQVSSGAAIESLSNPLPNLLPLCHHHHRLVHEGGWQVIRAGDGVQFIPPERVIPRRVRGPGMRWAA